MVQKIIQICSTDAGNCVREKQGGQLKRFGQNKDTKMELTRKQGDTHANEVLKPGLDGNGNLVSENPSGSRIGSSGNLSLALQRELPDFGGNNSELGAGDEHHCTGSLSSVNGENREHRLVSCLRAAGKTLLSNAP
jgi:hypothetical protein